MRRALRLTGRAALLLLAALVLFAIVFAASGWESFGATPDGARQVRIEASPQWHDGRFENHQKKWIDTLAPHGWTEPIERVLVAARCQDVQIATPQPWESFEPATVKPAARWWPAVPWRSAEQKPVLSTIDGEASRRFRTPDCAALAREKVLRDS